MSDLSRQADTRPLTQTAPLVGSAFLALLSLPGLLLLWRTAERISALLAYPYPNDGLEGTLLHEARQLRAGEPLYPPFEPHHFVSAPYPPLHPLILGLADQIAGPHIFWGGRLISLVAALLCALCVVLIARRAGGSWVAGLLGAAIFLNAPPVILWATRIKPDMFGLLWVALGLYLTSLTIDDRRSTTEPPAVHRWSMAYRLSFIGAAICFALAFFTKQTMVAAPLAAGLALLIADVRAFRRGERAGYVGRVPLRQRTLAFGLLYLALVLGGWALLDQITGGQYDVHLWWSGQRANWWSFALMSKFVALLAPYWPLMLLGVGLLLGATRHSRALVPACYLLFAPITLFGAGQIGANHNHLLETLLALSVAGGVLTGWAAGMLARVPTRAALALLVFAGQIGLLFQPPPAWYGSELAPDDSPERFLAFMRSTPGEILADNPGLLLMAGKPIRYDDPSSMEPTAVLGVWDQRGLLDDIAQRRFSAIMIPIDVQHESIDAARRWSPEMIAAIRDHYRLLYRDSTWTYVPKD